MEEEKVYINSLFIIYDNNKKYLNKYQGEKKYSSYHSIITEIILKKVDGVSWIILHCYLCNLRI
jgi:hypothetical protein